MLSPYLYVAPSDLVSPTLAGEAGDRLRGLRLWVLRSLALGGPVGMLRSTAQQSEAPEAQVELIEEVLELRHLQSKRELERERERKKKKGGTSRLPMLLPAFLRAVARHLMLRPLRSCTKALHLSNQNQETPEECEPGTHNMIKGKSLNPKPFSHQPSVGKQGKQAPPQQAGPPCPPAPHLGPRLRLRCSQSALSFSKGLGFRA